MSDIFEIILVCTMAVIASLISLFMISLSMKRLRNRILFLVISTGVIASLISSFVIVPLAFGDRFVSYSFQLHPCWYGVRPIEIVHVNGSLIKIGWIGLRITKTNNYFRPVQVHYNGFEYVMLVYNCTVADPSDIVNNKPFLVWGAFYALRALSNVLRLSKPWAYNYYATHRNLSNYTATLPAGAFTSTVFSAAATEPVWGGQDLNGEFVSPGIYRIYCIAYGRKLEPISLNITRTELWDDC